MSMQHNNPAGIARRVESLESSLDLLMSLFAIKPSVWLAQAVLTHLESLTTLPGQVPLTDERRNSYRELVPAWQGIARRLVAMESAMPA